uniref:Glutamine amidotransferase-like class 1 domain-containing protein 1 n=1 Tax=Callithrix jacchus TaxID=9483 RepID=A0A8I4A0F3_CALJA
MPPAAHPAREDPRDPTHRPRQARMQKPPEPKWARPGTAQERRGARSRPDRGRTRRRPAPPEPRPAPPPATAARDPRPPGRAHAQTQRRARAMAAERLPSRPACLLVASGAAEGVSAQSFLHCFTMASTAFNLQVATPGGKAMDFVDVTESNARSVQDFRLKAYASPAKLESIDGARYHALLIPSCPGALSDLASSGSLARILQHFRSERSRWPGARGRGWMYNSQEMGLPAAGRWEGAQVGFSGPLVSGHCSGCGWEAVTHTRTCPLLVTVLQASGWAPAGGWPCPSWAPHEQGRTPAWFLPEKPGIQGWAWGLRLAGVWEGSPWQPGSRPGSVLAVMSVSTGRVDRPALYTAPFAGGARPVLYTAPFAGGARPLCRAAGLCALGLLGEQTWEEGAGQAAQAWGSHK